TVSLPSGRWRYLFDDREVFSGPRKIVRDFPLQEFPVFVREGASVPLNVQRSYTALGDTNSSGFRTWLIYPSGSTAFTLYHPETHPNSVTTTLKVEAGKSLKILFEGKHEPHILLVHADEKPSKITLDGA